MESNWNHYGRLLDKSEADWLSGIVNDEDAARHVLAIFSDLLSDAAGLATLEELPEIVFALAPLADMIGAKRGAN